MSEKVVQLLRDKPVARWTALGLVAFTMFCGYYFSDVMAPLKKMLETDLHWNSTEYGVFTSAYGWFNVFLLMLVFGGLILDKVGVRFTGIGAIVVMIGGAFIKYYAVSHPDSFSGTVNMWVPFMGTSTIKTQTLMAGLGFATFGVGVEVAGITVSKAIVRWFKGKEMALAMGLEMATARLGTALTLLGSFPLAHHFQQVSAPLLFGVVLLCIGLIGWLVFIVMDRKLDASAGALEMEPEEPFRVRDIVSIIRSRGFWLVAILCVLFYSAVFPFLKYAPDLMLNKYGVSEGLSGMIPSILPFGTILLTPFFGNLYDRKGKGATIMIIGALMLIGVHFLFTMPILNVWWFALLLMIILGIAFSLVPSAMWPSVPKIIDENKLGTAYALIFWVQNWGLTLVPLLIGVVLDKYCIIGQNADGSKAYNYFLPMAIFTAFGILAILTALWLKREDKRKNYGLEKPNIKA